MKFNRILILLFFLFSLLHQIIGLKEDLIFLRLAQLVGFFAFFKLLMDFELKVIIRKTTFKILLISIISTITVGIVNNRLYLLNLVYPLCFFSISWMMVNAKLAPRFFVIVTLLVVSVFSLLYLTNVPPSEWVKGSRNYVSVLLMYLTITSSCVALINTRVPNFLVHLLLPLLCMIFTILALGRAGIITALLLFFVNTLYYFDGIKKNGWKILIFLFLLSIALFTSDRFDSIQSNYLYKFERKGFDLDERGDIINLYLEKLDFLSSIFSLPDYSFMRAVGGLTFHNSFIHWHYTYGFGSFLILFLVIHSIFKSFRREIYLNLLLVLVLVRSFTDQVLLSDGILLGLPFFLIIAINDRNTFFQKQ